MNAASDPAASTVRPPIGGAAGGAGQAGSPAGLPGAYLSLHSVADRAPNAGIWRLMWWLCGGRASEVIGDDRVLRVVRAGVSKPLFDRMVAGTVVPDPSLAVAIAQATDGQVLPEDFELATHRGPVRPHWSEMPAPRGVPPRTDTARGRGDQRDDQRNPDPEQHDAP